MDDSDPLGETAISSIPRSTNSNCVNAKEVRQKNRERKLTYTWTSAEESALIVAVQKRITLWNVECPEYKIPDLKRSCWEEVAEELSTDGINATQAKLKWNSMRSNFKSCLGKYRAKKSGQGAEDSITVSWPHFNEMVFIVSGEVQQLEHSTIDQSIMDDLSQPMNVVVQCRKRKIDETIPRSTSNHAKAVRKKECDRLRERKLLYTWSSAEESALIEAVQKRSKLWDARCLEYNAAHLKKPCWEEVAEELSTDGINAIQAKLKWNSMRSNFKSCLGKYRAKSSGAENPITVRWPHFNEMMFIVSGEVQPSTASNSTAIASSPADFEIITDLKVEYEDSMSSCHDSFVITRLSERTAVPLLGSETASDSYIENFQETPTNYKFDSNSPDQNTNPPEISYNALDESQFREKKLEMYGALVDVLRSHDESEKKFREESLKCQQSMANAMNNMATSFLAISQALLNLSKQNKNS